ncbi:MAG: acyl carrier protein [Gammaproteobacteria bacterium]|nr:acyl carrier protein [Gammaproteobacteria bacterium]
MSSTKDRVGTLARKFLDENAEPDFAKSFDEAEVSSLDAMAFLKAITSEFNVEISPEKLSEMSNLQDIVDFLDG